MKHTVLKYSNNFPAFITAGSIIGAFTSNTVASVKNWKVNTANKSPGKQSAASHLLMPKYNRDCSSFRAIYFECDSYNIPTVLDDYHRRNQGWCCLTLRRAAPWRSNRVRLKALYWVPRS